MSAPIFTKITPTQNNYFGTISQIITLWAITPTVTPTPDGSTWYITIYDPDDSTKTEICKYTANASWVLTIPLAGRGLSWTIAQTHSAWKRVVFSLTAEHLNEIDVLLENTVYKTWDQTIAWVKTFSDGIKWTTWETILTFSKTPSNSDTIWATLSSLFAMKLDDFTSPDDNTDLDSTTVRHGLLPKLPWDVTKFLNWNGLWSVPSTSWPWGWDLLAVNNLTDVWNTATALANLWGISLAWAKWIKLDDFTTPDDNTDLNATTWHHGLLPKLSWSTSQFLRWDWTFTTITTDLVNDTTPQLWGDLDVNWKDILVTDTFSIKNSSWAIFKVKWTWVWTQCVFIWNNSWNVWTSWATANVWVGQYTLEALNTWDNNVAIGNSALRNTTSWNSNISLWSSSLFSNTTWSSNIAIWVQSLYWNTIWKGKIAIWEIVLRWDNIDTSSSPTTANIWIWYYALSTLWMTWIWNIWIWWYSLWSLTSWLYNTVVWSNPCSNLTTWNFNTCFWAYSLPINSTWSNNTIIWYYSWVTSWSLSDMTSIWYYSTCWSEWVTVWSIAYWWWTWNVVLWYNAWSNTDTSTYNVMIWHWAWVSNYSNSWCVMIWYNSWSTWAFNNAMSLWAWAIVDAQNHVRIWDTNITQIWGQTAWSNLSDRRDKENIIDCKLGLDFIMNLRPVYFNFNNSTDKEQKIGLIAQEVETVMTQLNASFSGLKKPENKNSRYALSYADFVTPLINAIKELKSEIDLLKNS